MFSYLRQFNRAILLIILSDLFSWGLYGVLNIFTGLYLEQRLAGDVIPIVGMGIFIYFIVRALVNIPIGKLLDTLPGNTDEARTLLIGSLLMGIPFLFYPLITHAYMYYGLQIIFGIGASLQVISSKKIVVLHLDKNREAEEYSVWDTFFCIFIATAGLVGSWLSSISTDIFSLVFVSFGVLIISSGVWARLYLDTFYTSRQTLLTILTLKVKQCLIKKSD